MGPFRCGLAENLHQYCTHFPSFLHCTLTDLMVSERREQHLNCNCNLNSLTSQQKLTRLKANLLSLIFFFLYCKYCSTFYLGLLYRETKTQNAVSDRLPSKQAKLSCLVCFQTVALTTCSPERTRHTDGNKALKKKRN
jgi:TRAP-type C4-dicarboxylate transport system permease small subunit